VGFSSLYCNDEPDLISARVYAVASILFFSGLHWQQFAASQLVLNVSARFGGQKEGRLEAVWPGWSLAICLRSGRGRFTVKVWTTPP
jgi:hypothetical protein